MSALLRHIGLVSESKRIKIGDLMKVAAGLQKQATRDLSPIWEISATVDAFERLEDVPIGYWRILIQDNIGIPGAAGIHEDRNGQPYALVTSSTDIDEWSLTCSHEMLEMLVDPSGNRMVEGDSPKLDQQRVKFLVEVCDPSEGARFGYSANGVLVSDFYTPAYFDPIKISVGRYSYTAAITKPRDVLEGGYLSWMDPETNVWWQLDWTQDPQPSFVNLGVMKKGSESLRSQIDRRNSAATMKALGAGRVTSRYAGVSTRESSKGPILQAAALREDIAALLGQAKGDATPAPQSITVRAVPGSAPEGSP